MRQKIVDTLQWYTDRVIDKKLIIGWLGHWPEGLFRKGLMLTQFLICHKKTDEKELDSFFN